jgi:hypothetical protein
MEDKKDSTDLYSDLPKHLEQFSPPDEAKIKFEPHVLEKITWKDVITEFFRSRFFKISASIIIPAIILNFWIFRYDDWTGNCHIGINMSLLEWNNLEQKRALKLIRAKSPNDYKKVCTYVKTISPDLPCGGSGGGCFHGVNPKQIEVSTLGHKNSPEITAAVIVHETCHSIQREEKRPYSESECYGEMNRFLNDIGFDSPWKNYK